MRHLNMRADSRQREELRSMVETLKNRSSVRGVDMKHELKREAVSLLGPELAREAFEASLSETRSEFHRQRNAAAASAAAAAEARRAGGGARVRGSAARVVRPAADDEIAGAVGYPEEHHRGRGGRRSRRNDRHQDGEPAAPAQAPELRRGQG